MIAKIANTKKLTSAASANSSGPKSEAQRAPGHRRQGRDGAQIVERDLEIVERQDEADEDRRPAATGQIVGSVISQKQRQRPRAEHHRRVVHVPVVAHQLRQDDEEPERGALHRVGRHRGVEIAGQAEHPRVEGEDGNADQQVGHEQGRDEQEQHQRRAGASGSAARRSRRPWPAASTAPRCRVAEHQAVRQRLAIERAGEQIVVGREGEGRRERPDDVGRERGVDHVEDRRVEEDVDARQHGRHRRTCESADAARCAAHCVIAPVKPLRLRSDGAASGTG